MSITGVQLWVIAYDSPSDKRRRKMAKLLEGYGERLQWSVFECRLQPHQLRGLGQCLNRIAMGEDSVRLWVVPKDPRRPSSWGSQWKLRTGKTK
jgi:CRISPR-associated protein Cas2